MVQSFKYLADSIPHQVWIARPDGSLEYVNQRVVDCFGRSADEIVGEGWLNMLHPDDVAPCVARWTRSLATGEPYEFEFRLWTAGEPRFRWYCARALPRRDDAGRILQWYGTNTDIDERRRAEVDRERLIEALSRSNRDLDEFAYVISHDLRAPLRGIKNLSEWIQEDLGDSVPQAGREHLGLLRERVQRLEALIDGVLHYARAGRAPEGPAPIDVGRLIAETIELLAPPATVTCTISGPMPTLVAERTPFQQVFSNLLGNAVKHARREDAHVEVRCQDAGLFWQFSVVDDGPGVAPQHHERIWGIFQTLEAQSAGAVSGIGLSIVKKIVTARGGRVWVESVLGQGAAFHVSWPKGAPSS